MNKNHMRTLYLIRHGHTLWNEERRYQGSSDQPLSELGRQQAERLAARLQKVPAAHIFTSPTCRAVETIRQAAQEKGLPVITEDDLREVDFGKWEGLREADVIAAFGGPEHYPDFLNEPDRFPCPGEQFFTEAQPRMVACAERLLREYPEGDLIIVSHLNTIKLLLMEWFSITDHDVFPRILIDNTAICAVQLDGEKRILQRMNDAAHLE